MPSDTFNARDFGARGDGATDDTDALQAWIDAAIGTGDPATTVRPARGPLYLPAGYYLVSKPLRIVSAENVQLRGCGRSSRLVPVGAMPSVLDINGVGYSTFGDFAIGGNPSAHAVEDGIFYYWEPKTAARSTTRNTFERIAIDDLRCVTGLRIGKDRTGTQVDTTTYRDLWISGAWTPGESRWSQYGVYVGDNLFANNLCHWGYGFAVDHWGTGVCVAASNFSLWGGDFAANGTDFHANTLAFFNVQGFRSETSGRLLETYGPSSSVATYSLSDVIWWPDRVAPDREMIRMRAGGTLALTNLQVPGAVKVKLATGPTLGQTLKLTGIVTPGTADEFLGPTPLATAVICNGYYQSVDGGQVAAMPGLDSSKGMRAKGDFVAVMGDLPPVPPPRERTETPAMIPRGKTAIVIQHGLGGQPALEDVAIIPDGPLPIWVSSVTEKTVTVQISPAAAAGGRKFTLSASRQP